MAEALKTTADLIAAGERRRASLAIILIFRARLILRRDGASFWLSVPYATWGVTLPSMLARAATSG